MTLHTHHFGNKVILPDSKEMQKNEEKRGSALLWDQAFWKRSHLLVQAALGGQALLVASSPVALFQLWREREDNKVEEIQPVLGTYVHVRTVSSVGPQYSNAQRGQQRATSKDLINSCRKQLTHIPHNRDGDRVLPIRPIAIAGSPGLLLSQTKLILIHAVQNCYNNFPFVDYHFVNESK